jgi:hypothetical protein
MQIPVSWQQGFNSIPGAYVKLWDDARERTSVLSSEGEIVGRLNVKYSLCDRGIYHARINGNPDYVDVTYWGPKSEPFAVI